MQIVLHPDQAREVEQISAEFDMPRDLVVRQLLSGPLLTRKPEGDLSDGDLEDALA